MESPKLLTSYRKFWAHRFGNAPFLPMSREEMDKLGWDSWPIYGCCCPLPNLPAFMPV